MYQRRRLTVSSPEPGDDDEENDADLDGCMVDLLVRPLFVITVVDAEDEDDDGGEVDDDEEVEDGVKRLKAAGSGDDRAKGDEDVCNC